MKTRIATALVLIAIVLALVFCSLPFPVLVLAAAVIAAGVYEIARMVGLSRPWIWVAAGIGILALVEGLRPARTAAELMATAWWGVGLSAVGFASTWRASALRTSEGEEAGRPTWSRRLSPLWVVGPILCLYALHQYGAGDSLWRLKTPVLLAVVPLWIGDTAAIFAGKAFGKRPLLPSVSPNKTWEGAIANLLACVAAALPLGLWLGFSPGLSVAAGVACGLFGQAGDLFESFVKRCAGVKDSGTLLPGHGGIMDRIDSMLGAAPWVALLVFLWPR